MGYLDFGKTKRVRCIVKEGIEKDLNLDNILEAVKSDLKAYGELSSDGKLSEMEINWVTDLYKEGVGEK